MPSMIAWLDVSHEDQRRMREIVNLFIQSESRDERSYSGRMDPPESNSTPAEERRLRGSSRAFGPWLIPEPG